MITLIALTSKCLRITGLEIFSPRRLYVHDGIVAPAWRVSWTKATVHTRRTWLMVNAIVERRSLAGIRRLCSVHDGYWFSIVRVWCEVGGWKCGKEGANAVGDLRLCSVVVHSLARLAGKSCLR